MILEALPWWSWSLLLFGFTTILGVIAVVAGVGGGVLFVPIVSALFPFHLDFIRGAGLMVALTGALSAGPHLLRSGLASLRLALPYGVIGTTASIFGALAGLALPETTVKLLLGIAIFGVVLVMVFSKGRPPIEPGHGDAIAKALRIRGSYVESTTNTPVHWTVRHTAAGFVLFIGVGFIAGLFGIGAGWASVPILHLLLAAPLKVAVATSALILSMNSGAAWIYFNSGAILPLIAVPSVLGMMIGTRIGARTLTWVKPNLARAAVISILLLAAIRQILEGTGVVS